MPGPGEVEVVVVVGESVGLVLVLLLVEDLRPKLVVQELLLADAASGGLCTLSAEFEPEGGSLRERVRRSAFNEEDAIDDNVLDLVRGTRGGLSRTVHSFSWLLPSRSLLGESMD